jgi:hypothetical protein
MTSKHKQVQQPSVATTTATIGMPSPVSCCLPTGRACTEVIVMDVPAVAVLVVIVFVVVLVVAVVMFVVVLVVTFVVVVVDLVVLDVVVEVVVVVVVVRAIAVIVPTLGPSRVQM